MTTRELLRTRLQTQKLNAPEFKTPADMVRYFGAVQAQDYFGSLWAVGQRVIGATELSVESALAGGSIVRSWPMRGTIHFTAPEDLCWILDLVGPRAIAKSAHTHREAGLTKKIFAKARPIFEKELAGGRNLERNEIYDLLKRNRIDPSNTRGLHIIGHMAREKVICCGPRRGKQPTFVLLDEWIKDKKILSREESLGELASMYFRSRGPATMYDFAWWSGLTITDAGKALDMIRSQVQMVSVDGNDLWMSQAPVLNEKINNNVRLLPSYDEFLVSYTDRSASETEATRKLVDRGQAIFTSVVIVNGLIVGTWKRTITKKGVSIKIQKFAKISKQAEAGLKKELKRYAAFIGAKLIA